MYIRDLMTTTPVSANLRDGLHQTYYRMRERSIRHMPVLDESGRLAGIITERDLLRPVFVDDGPGTSGSFVLDNSRRVSEAMTPAPTTITADATVADVLPLFVKRRYGAVPVVDADNRLVGIVSTIDMLRQLEQRLSG